MKENLNKSKEENMKIEVTDDQPTKDNMDKKTDSDLNADENVQQSELENQLKLKDEELAAKDSLIKDFNDKYLRLQAEFDNYKKRTDKEKAILLEYGAEGFVYRLLPVIDDLERSITHINESSDVNLIKEGIINIYKKFHKVLEDQGIKPIETEKQIFDHNFHEAIQTIAVPDAQPHEIVQEVEKGYMYKDKVIRYSKVIVNKEAE